HIRTIIGDMADVDADGEFDLVYVVFSTFFGLLNQADQVRCFANVAERLKPDGAFVIQAFVPDLSRFELGQRVHVSEIGTDDVAIEASRHDPVEQTVMTQKVLMSNDGVRLLPVRVRYAWPSELDLMARLAGLQLRE